MTDHDPDAQRFRDYAEGRTNDSPVESDWRQDAPRLRDFKVAIGGGNFITVQAEDAQDASDIARKQGHRVMFSQLIKD